jgi:Fe-S oxidoreductase
MGIVNKIKEMIRFNITNTNILYYPGCLTKFVLKDIKQNYKKILDWLEISYIEINELGCCGSPVLNSGYMKDFENLIKNNKKILEDYGIGTIISNCPSCCSMFKRYYPEYKVYHITEIINFNSLNVENKKITVENEKITYHDPCHLGRYLGIYEKPREILRNLGFEIIEMENNKQFSNCCGGGGNLNNNFPEISEKLAKSRINEAIKTGCKVLVTTCPMCYLQLKKHSESKIKVMEFSEVFIRVLE